jgi:hypothetical protein
MTYGLVAACTDHATLARALAIIEQLPDIRGMVPLPVRETQTLAMELVMQKALSCGLEAAILDSASFHRYNEHRQESQYA